MLKCTALVGHNLVEVSGLFAGRRVVFLQLHNKTNRVQQSKLKNSPMNLMLSTPDWSEEDCRASVPWTDAFQGAKKKWTDTDIGRLLKTRFSNEKSSAVRTRIVTFLEGGGEWYWRW